MLLYRVMFMPGIIYYFCQKYCDCVMLKQQWVSETADELGLCYANAYAALPLTLVKLRRMLEL